MSAAEHLERARAHLSAGRLEDAMAAAREALVEEPGNLDGMLISARIVRRAGNPAAAAKLYDVILEHYPDSAAAHAGLGACHGLQGEYSPAEAQFRRAVSLQPNYFEAWSFLAEALIEQGKTEEAMDCFEESLALSPYNQTALSKYLFHAVFDPRYDAARVAELNRDWGVKLAKSVTAYPDRRVSGIGEKIRIGYLSDEFYERVTARFMTPVLAHHDKSRFHVSCFARNTVQDETTAALARHADAWRDLSAMDDKTAAAAIHAERIDILVICTSYRAETRTILAFKPAPIQVCYLNLVSTTGLPTVDYLISETATDPDGCDADYTENLVRLSNGNIYQAPSATPDPVSPPCLETGAVTFASFNNLGKVTPAVIALWSRILTALPKSKLIMKSVNRFSDPGARRYFSDLFAAADIGMDRLAFLSGDDDLQTHLARYGQVDIALDPYPCNGGTTSHEALWMGVPVVTRLGDSFMGRQGAKLLGKLELGDLIARTDEEYVAAAISLANDTARLKALRGELRIRVSAHLADPRSHVGELEAAYEEMIKRHRAGKNPTPFKIQDNQVLA